MPLIAVITGSSQGIGKSLAEVFVEDGFRVIAIARTRSRLDELAREIKEIDPYTCDVSKPEHVAALGRAIAEKYSHIDVLINNAGAAYSEPIEDTTLEHWNEVLQTNLTGPFLMTKMALPLLMKSKRPHLFNICSTASRRGFANSSSYCASKFGLLGLTEVIREEFRPKGIKVTAVIPGAVHTPLWDTYAADFDRNIMLDPHDVAVAIRDAYRQPINAVVEEIVIKPACGDL